MPNNLATEIQQRCNIYQHNSSIINKLHYMSQYIQHNHWTTPQLGCIRVDTNCTVKRLGEVGCGGIIRDLTGAWYGGFSKCIGAGDVFLAKLHEVYECMKLNFA